MINRKQLYPNKLIYKEVIKENIPSFTFFLLFSLVGICKEIGIVFSAYFSVSFTTNQSNILDLIISFSLMIAGFVSNFLIDRFYNTLEFSLELKCRQSIGKILSNIDYKYLLQDEYYLNMEDVKNNFFSSSSIMFFSSINYLKSTILLLTYVFILLFYGNFLSIIAIPFSIGLTVLIYFLNEKEYKRISEYESCNFRKSYLYSFLIDRIKKREINYTDSFDYYNRRKNNAEYDYICSQKRKDNFGIIKALVVGFLEFCFFAINIIFVLKDGFSKADIANIVIILTVSFVLYTESQSLITNISLNREGKYHIDLFNKNFNKVKKYEPYNEEINSISLKNVSLHINGTKLIKGFTGDFQKNNIYLILGENGSGKTTICDIISCLYKNIKGKIEVNGTISDLNFNNRIAYMSQNFPVIDLTIKEVLNNNCDDAEIYKVFEQVGISKKVKSLKNGLNTYIGRMDEEGSLFSKGEWQKFCIAKTILQENKDILIFDEPFSSLDVIAESNIFNILRSIKNKIIIVVSHRIYNSPKADRVICLANGKTVCKGSHQYLMKTDKTYKQMYENQLKLYI